MTHLDASFVFDLLREASRDKRGPATFLLDDLRGEELGMSVHVVCELLAGAELSPQPTAERRRVEELCEAARIAYPDKRFPRAYAQLLAGMHRAGQRISTMDLLIATAALLAPARLVSRNVKDFSRVPGLEVLGY